MTRDKNFSSILELLDVFSDEKMCIEHLAQMRWNGKPLCPYCNHDKIYKFKSGKKFKCAKCRHLFSVRVGTIFEDSNVPLRKWFVALYLETSHKKGISSYQLSRDIKVTQKTAWFMLHRIREIYGNSSTEKLSGIISADETFIGGRNKNRHADKKVKESTGRALKDKTPVIGVIQRDGKVIAKKAPDTKGKTLKGFINENVEQNSTVVTDEWLGYKGLSKNYQHEVVMHRLREYVRDGYHTNEIEGFWALLKRGIFGIYHFVSPKHLQRYCDEFTFRYNTRHISEETRFNKALNECNSPLPYKKLVG